MSFRIHPRQLILPAIPLALWFGLPHTYETARVIHFLALISWYAGLFYLPRLFVYHATHQNQTAVSDTLKTMEYKLFHYIMTPAMIFTLATGVWLMGFHAGPASPWLPLWLWLKLAVLLGLFLYHHLCARVVAEFAQDQNKRSHVWYRVFNEVPTLILIAIVVLAVVRPGGA
jgi:putative membrane protein